MKPPRYFALIPAAGMGTRMESAIPKQYLALNGKPMLTHVLNTLAAAPIIARVFVVVSAEDGWIDEALAATGDHGERIIVLRRGGATRQQTVLNGLHAMRDIVAENDWVMVHDGARPGLTVAMINRLVQGIADDAVGGLLAMPVVDTVKRAENGRAVATVPRETLWAAQTPQMFRYTLLLDALVQAAGVTDEASAVEQLGLHPRLVAGSPRNFKVTLPSDITVAELLMKGNE
jgi:2-C-methyl-D-erythritol 4-phosphate cytidylyltransferase